MEFEDLLHKNILSESNKLLIVCQSYPNVKNSLYFLDKCASSVEKHIIVVGNQLLYRLFSEVNSAYFDGSINLQFFSVPEPNIKLTPSWLINIVMYKRRNRQISMQLAEIYKDFDIVFFSKEFTSLGFYFINKLRRTNRLIHVPDPGCDVYEMSDRKPANFKECIKLLYVKSLYNRHLQLGSAGRKIRGSFYKISDPYMAKYVDVTVPVDQRDQAQTGFEISKYTVAANKAYSIVYFDKDFVRDSLCVEEVYQNELDKIFSIISNHVESSTLAKKYKPNRTSDRNRDRIQYGNMIPDHIPAEMLYRNDVKIYIGSTSIALANIPRGNVISIAYLLTFIQPEWRERSIANQELRKVGNTIYYPRTLNEFESLLKRFLD